MLARYKNLFVHYYPGLQYKIDIHIPSVARQ